jgi:hypothetical protein
VQALRLLAGSAVVPSGQSAAGTGVGQSRAPSMAEQAGAATEHCRFSKKCGASTLNTGRPPILR